MNDKILLFRHRLTVRWGDMDSYSHVNNTTYLEYIQEARVAWFASLGIAMDHVPQGPVVLQTQHTYLKPVVYPAEVVIDLYAGPVGNSSLVVEHRLSVSGDGQTCYGEGYCKLVWIDHGSERPVPVPPELKRIMGAA